MKNCSVLNHVRTGSMLGHGGGSGYILALLACSQHFGEPTLALRAHPLENGLSFLASGRSPWTPEAPRCDLANWIRDVRSVPLEL